MSQLNLKPAHAAVKTYYAALTQMGQLHFDNEAQVSDAFAKLLANCGRKLHLTFVPQFSIQRAKTRVIVDGALVDDFHLAHGFWEAKDEKDDLEREIKSKFEKGYPRDNIIFQAPERAVLYQSGARIADLDISKPDYLTQIVNQFFDYKAPHIEEWEQAVTEFSERIPELAAAVKKIIDEERRRNPAFVRSFDDFYALCRQAINPNLSEDAVERMLIQHLLTERIFVRIFKDSDFTRRNVVSAEIEKVIVELTKRAFNRNEFLRPLDRFYKAIEVSAENTTGFSEKQAFLNKVYERFFQGYSPKEADTHGIVYTPQPIVNFMVRSVEEILRKEFGRSLGDKGVHILDPFVGTGNFIVNIMDKIKATDLPYKYENELHCNEVMLLPYYIASMNIEHAYFERTGEYSAFPGICLVDTFELAEAEQASLGFMTAENAERVKRQKESPIFVIIGNPPYNAWQVNENDNNRNRRYKELDSRLARTYAEGSAATNKIALSDPYVKAFLWASDRISPEGVVAFVSNNGFLDGVAFDGMRRDLADRFSAIYHVNLKGNARTSGERRRREGGNIFDDAIRVGVGITILVRRKAAEKKPNQIFLHSVEDHLSSAAKRQFLEAHTDVGQVKWEQVKRNDRGWSSGGGIDDASTHPLMGSSQGKQGHDETGLLFRLYSRGAETTRDSWVYNFSADDLAANVGRMIEMYNQELDRWNRSTKKNVDSFVLADEKKIKWSSRLKELLQANARAQFHLTHVRKALYRPFTREFLYFDEVLNHRQGRLPECLPTAESENENRLIVTSDIASRSSFSVLIASVLPDLHLCAGVDAFQCFPFYTYAEDGTHRRENITDWALEQFRSHYHDRSITKWDIFHYIYAVLHHPEYRERYAANLRRELPRIPFANATTLNNCHSEPAKAGEESAVLPAGKQQIPPSGRNDNPQEASVSPVSSVVKDLEVFRDLVKAGQRLAEIHVHYEQQPEYQLTKTEKAGERLDYRVAKMRLSKDKTSLIYNQFLTLSEIPKETYDYRLGNRSALEWVIDQYQVSTDKRSGITNDPNREDDPQYVLRLIGQVITVSLETVKIVKALPGLGIPELPGG